MNKLSQTFIKYKFALLPALLFLEAIHLRVYFSKQVSGDFTVFVNPWVNFIRDQGIWQAFQYPFSDYSPLYLHVLAIFSLFMKNNLLLVKTVSWIFEIIAVIYFSKILSHFNMKKEKRWLYVALFILLPTLVLNGGYWAQCDILYVSMGMAAIYYLLKEKYFLSYLFLGLSFSFKLQAIFIFPLFFVHFLFHKETAKYFALVPLVYLTSLLPSLLAGRDFIDLLTIYFRQAKTYDPLVLNSTTVYNLIPHSKDYREILSLAGIVFTGVVILLLCFFIYRKKKKTGLLKTDVINCTLLFSIAVPYFLPHMHDRYFLFADIFSLFYVLVVRKNYFVPVIILASSLQCYLYYLKFFKIISPDHLAFLMLLVLLFMVWECLKTPATDTAEIHAREIL